jgi:hypothetical protein
VMQGAQNVIQHCLRQSRTRDLVKNGGKALFCRRSILDGYKNHG